MAVLGKGFQIVSPPAGKELAGRFRLDHRPDRAAEAGPEGRSGYRTQPPSRGRQMDRLGDLIVQELFGPRLRAIDHLAEPRQVARLERGRRRWYELAVLLGEVPRAPHQRFAGVGRCAALYGLDEILHRAGSFQRVRQMRGVAAACGPPCRGRL